MDMDSDRVHVFIPHLSISVSVVNSVFSPDDEDASGILGSGSARSGLRRGGSSSAGF